MSTDPLSPRGQQSQLPLDVTSQAQVNSDKNTNPLGEEEEEKPTKSCDVRGPQRGKNPNPNVKATKLF